MIYQFVQSFQPYSWEESSVDNICFLYLLQCCGASNLAEMRKFIWNVNVFAQVVVCFTSFNHYKLACGILPVWQKRRMLLQDT